MKKLFLLLTFCFGLVSSTAFAQDETTEAEALEDYKTACLAAIDNISLIGDNFTIRSMVSLAKTSLGICSTTDAMSRTMTALRAGVIGYLQTVKTFDDGQVYTGLVGNHSFDTGDLSSWYCVGFDISQLSLTDLANAMSGGDVSGLVNAVSVNNWNENTKAFENQGANAVQGGSGKYYLGSNQLMMQPILGLPAGIYSLNAKVACTPGFLNLSKVHLNALVVPTSTVQEVIGDVLSNTSDWGELLTNFNLTQYMGPFLQSGKLYTEAISCKNISTLSDGELRFVIDEGDILVIGMNAGMIPFVGTDQFRADNLQLVGLRAADGLLDIAKASLGEALQGHTAIEANYNADTDGTTTQPAFTFDKTITENYNEALRTAKDKFDKDKLADILTKSDLNNINGLDTSLKNHYSKDIQVLNKAKEQFDKQAFIAPATGEAFNIVMKDNWISLTTKWTGNAISIDEDKTLRFSQEPGQSVFALAFSFERASRGYTNQLYAFVSDYRNKYYLGEKDGGTFLTTDQTEAAIITALPSYTEEGEIKLMVSDMYLGTTSSDNTLVGTDSGTILRPTRIRLLILPASEMEFTISIPAGQNASTLILPFDAKLPEEVGALSVTGINEGLECIEGEAATSLQANTPYVILAPEGEYTFRGVPHAILSSYDEGLLIGTYTPYTTQGTDEYKMTVEDDFCVFRRMDEQLVSENECYLKCDFPRDVIYVNQADAVTGIDEIKHETIKDNPSDAWYNLGGQRVNRTFQKGIYIRKAKSKVMIF